MRSAHGHASLSLALESDVLEDFAFSEEKTNNGKDKEKQNVVKMESTSADRMAKASFFGEEKGNVFE